VQEGEASENSEMSQDPSTSMRLSLRSKGDILTGNINGLPVFSKAAPLRCKIGSFAFVFIIFAGVWRSSLKF
jgi:hypothetical protein